MECWGNPLPTCVVPGVPGGPGRPASGDPTSGIPLIGTPALGAPDCRWSRGPGLWVRCGLPVLAVGAELSTPGVGGACKITGALLWGHALPVGILIEPLRTDAASLALGGNLVGRWVGVPWRESSLLPSPGVAPRPSHGSCSGSLVEPPLSKGRVCAACLRPPCPGPCLHPKLALPPQSPADEHTPPAAWPQRCS